LNQDKVGSESDDGCDAVILRIDKEKQAIEFAGAKLGLFQITAQGQVTRHLGARCSLGYQDVIAEMDRPELKTIQYAAGDAFAIVTDGITDQIGGANGKTSYGYRRLEEILKTHCSTSAQEIIQEMSKDFAAWQGANTRRDDVTVVVFRL
jgi:serine/threonine protein phosphatase PrpC